MMAAVAPKARMGYSRYEFMGAVVRFDTKIAGSDAEGNKKIFPL